MNCKKDDLAIVVSSQVGLKTNLGKIVRCLEFKPAVKVTYPPEGKLLGITNVWKVEPNLIGWDGQPSHWIADSCLRPIDNPGEDEKDEMLRPLPKKLEV